MDDENNNLNKKKDVTKRKKVTLSISKLKQIQKDEQVVDMLVQDIDDSFNMIGIIGNNIKAIIPRDEASSIVGDDGLVDSKHKRYYTK